MAYRINTRADEENDVLVACFLCLHRSIVRVKITDFSYLSMLLSPAGEIPDPVIFFAFHLRERYKNKIIFLENKERVKNSGDSSWR
ncbi:MAG: hypothetical protein OXL41_15475 [Nitrospinae bacterium]|nr:hypothetical protein [Nitrospinota bacterium]